MSAIELTLRHLRLSQDEAGIAWLQLDRVDKGANSLNGALIAELEQVFVQLKSHPPLGLIIESAKKGGFVAGADIGEFIDLYDQAEALELIRRGQGVMNLLATLPFPTVAVIDGFCLGGGMELALACRYRLASNDPRTKLGLPEVKLGIHPGFGGAVRLPRLIGPLPAMTLMLTGRSVDGGRA
ncbi:MAG: enoyl-CoA hydratase/isomerase family protein, partial [Magnetococcales bacterium]|nr:enoyl-CoA hydratase/isomerase family protein [Magnetococcales bacterium]